jgi:hypothetical protein
VWPRREIDSVESEMPIWKRSFGYWIDLVDNVPVRLVDNHLTNSTSSFY